MKRLMIPLVQISTSLRLYGSIQGIILVHVIYGIPITTLIFRNYCLGIPTEVIEAARVDGAGFSRIYTSCCRSRRRDSSLS